MESIRGFFLWLTWFQRFGLSRPTWRIIPGLVGGPLQVVFIDFIGLKNLIYNYREAPYTWEKWNHDQNIIQQSWVVKKHNVFVVSVTNRSCFLEQKSNVLN